LPEVIVGMIDASTTRRPASPCTRNWSSTTAIGSRGEIMRITQTNTPTGAKYARAMSEWLLRHKIHEIIDNPGLSRLQRCIENLPAIQSWLGEHVDIKVQLKWNHPSTIWSNYQKFLKPALKSDFRPNLKDEAIRKLTEENDSYQQTVAEMQGRERDLEKQLETARADREWDEARSPTEDRRSEAGVEASPVDAPPEPEAPRLTVPEHDEPARPQPYLAERKVDEPIAEEGWRKRAELAERENEKWQTRCEKAETALEVAERKISAQKAMLDMLSTKGRALPPKGSDPKGLPPSVRSGEAGLPKRGRSKRTP
jgi:hypothetical protein